MERQRCTRAFGGALALIVVSVSSVFARPTLQFEMVRYDYPSAPTYAEGEPEYYQRVLVEKGGPVVPGWLIANWLWDMVPTGCQQIPRAKLRFYVNDLLEPGLGVVKIKGCAVDTGTGFVAVHFDYSVAFYRRDFWANPRAPVDFNTPIGGYTVLWLGYFPDGMTSIGMYLVVRVKGQRFAPVYEPGKSVIEGYSKG